MWYISWVVGLVCAIFITVTVVAKIEKSGFFDKYENDSTTEIENGKK